MSCIKNFNAVTKNNGTHAQVTKSDLEKREEINPSQQHHNIDNLNGETLDCNVSKAQMLADVMCDMNKTFRTEENFVNPWQKSWTDCKKENCKQQCVQQCTLNKGLKKHDKREEDAVLKETTQSHDRACFEPIKVEEMTPEEKQQAQIA